MIPLFITIGAALLVLWLGVILYLRSVSTRKIYTCPECGEKFQVELMAASHCNTCGAPVKRTGVWR